MTMVLAVDVHYHDDGTAVAAGIVFPSWETDEVLEEAVVTVDEVAAYVPGEFYLRELPCILKLLGQIESRYDCIVIDGYVSLGADEKPGLGMKLWEALEGRVPVVGVAKSRYIGTAINHQVLRGASRRPLYVSVIGIPIDEAKEAIRRMKGCHRIPILLKKLGQLAKSIA